MPNTSKPSRARALEPRALAASSTSSGGFEPFGEDWSNARSFGLNLRLPGQWDDPYWHRDPDAKYVGADLYYNVHRWYEPGTGRYVSADPLGLLAGVQLFAYVGDRPTAAVDPLGLAGCDWDSGFLGCRGPGGSCCVAACIDDLRKALCNHREADSGINLASVLWGAGTGAATFGARFGWSPAAICAGAAIGGASGAGLSYPFSGNDVFKFHQRTQFRQCVGGCRPDRPLCSSGGPCWIDGQFALVAAEF